MTEKEIARLYKKAKPQVQTKEYYRMQHERHKEKRNAMKKKGISWKGEWNDEGHFKKYYLEV